MDPDKHDAAAESGDRIRDLGVKRPLLPGCLLNLVEGADVLLQHFSWCRPGLERHLAYSIRMSTFSMWFRYVQILITWQPFKVV